VACAAQLVFCTNQEFVIDQVSKVVEDIITVGINLNKGVSEPSRVLSPARLFGEDIVKLMPYDDFKKAF
jgi:hypothetical protein